jgi:hypothetical protein
MILAAGVRFQAGVRQSSVLHIVQTCPGVNTASYPIDTGGFAPRKQSGWSMKLTTHFHLVPRSRMTFTSPYVFIAWHLISQAAIKALDKHQITSKLV